jgi:hypothetical protein
MQKQRVRTRTWRCLGEQGKKSGFDLAAVVRGLVGVRANGPGGGEGLALGEWEKKTGG